MSVFLFVILAIAFWIEWCTTGRGELVGTQSGFKDTSQEEGRGRNIDPVGVLSQLFALANLAHQEDQSHCAPKWEAV